MTFRDALTALRERWRIVAVCVLLAVVAAGVLALVRPPQYTSHVLLYVSSAPQDDRDSAYQGGLLSEQRVASYVELVDQPSVTGEIARRLNLPLSPDEVADHISATSSADSVLIDVAVVDRSPQEATALADTFGQVFPQLVNRIETPRTPAAQPAVTVSPVEPATVPTSPSSLGPVTAGLLGLLAGLLVGVVAALLTHLLDNRVTTRSRLEDVSGRPTLASLVLDPAVEKAPLVVVDRPQAPLAEAYRALRTNLRYLRPGRGPSVLLFTSSRPGEGKSLTSVNVAIALAASTTRVLLVEADLRRPRVAQYMNLQDGVGLSTCLVGRIGLDDAVQRWRGTGLDVLASGHLPPNPSELLGSDEMRELLDAARERYDVVLVDTPPVLPVTDAAALAPFTDGALLVCRHGVVTDGQVRASVAALTAVGAPVLGTILSATPAGGSGADRYGTYGYGYATAEPPPAPAAPTARPRPATTAAAADATTETDAPETDAPETDAPETDHHPETSPISLVSVRPGGRDPEA